MLSPLQWNVFNVYSSAYLWYRNIWLYINILSCYFAMLCCVRKSNVYFCTCQFCCCCLYRKYICYKMHHLYIVYMMSNAHENKVSLILINVALVKLLCRSKWICSSVQQLGKMKVVFHPGYRGKKMVQAEELNIHSR